MDPPRPENPQEATGEAQPSHPPAANPPQNDELSALRQVTQRLLQQNERIMKHLQDSQQAQPPRRGLTPLGEASEEGNSSQAPRRSSAREDSRMSRDRSNGPSRTNSSEREDRWEDRFLDLQQELGQMKKAMKAKTPTSMDVLVSQTESPFTKKVLRSPLPSKFKMPQIEAYDGTKDPVDHLSAYQNHMELHGYSDPVRCRAFSTTLKGQALAWVSRLPPGSVSTFRELSLSFTSHFVGARVYRKPSYHLLTVKQEDGESLRSYVQRFNSESLKVDGLEERFAVNAFITGLGAQSNNLTLSASKNPQASLAEVLAKAEKYINGEEAILSKMKSSTRPREKEEKKKDRSPRKGKERRSSPRRDRDRSPRRGGNGRDRPTFKHPEEHHRFRPDRPELQPRFVQERYTPLTASVSQIFREVQHENLLKWPPRMWKDPALRDRTKYCKFHRDHGHDTDDCYQLKREIELLIQQGHLRRFTGKARSSPPPPAQPSTAVPHQQTVAEINTISGGFAGGGESNSARRAHLRRIRAGRDVSVHAVSKFPRIDTTITFSDEDLSGFEHPHDDPLVIRAVVANRLVRRILIDNGSSADIIFAQAFDQMGVGRERLEPIATHLLGFAGEKVLPLGSIDLVLTVGDPPCQSTTIVKFLVVDAPSAYNVLLGRPSLNALRAVPSAYHLVMKFPTENGVGMIRGDQHAARECYAASMKRKEVKTVLLEDLDMRDEMEVRPMPSEELESVQLDQDPEHVVYVGSKLGADLKGPLTQFLKENLGVFAWKQEDMEGIDPSIITHKLGVDPTCKPIKQKKRSVAPERQRAINEEVGKLLRAKAIREVDYPTWLANVVLVKKANGKWRLCIDFTNLNQACPKDSFPLPRIDLVVDATAGHELLSFTDAFSGYNQIRMEPSDQEKTSFVTEQGTFCYLVMPFGLKNAGATYQRLVNRMFQKQIGSTMEVYVDDMLVKSLKAADHIEHLAESFQVLKNYKMKLNPTKCAFGVSAGKFLGFIVSSRGIEANPDKVRAMLEMQSPSTTKEVQRLTGRVAALNRFVSRSSDKCQPFFQVLKKAFQWDTKCEKAFQAMKTYMSSPPVLVSPVEGEVLTLYLSVSDFSTSAALVREKNRIQQPVYYCSRALRGAEERYPKMEKLVLALVVTARRLRPYFQAHTIEIPTDQPMKQVLHKPESSGRLVKWAVELSEFDIRYKPRTTIKGQVLADFIAEFTTAAVSPEQTADMIPDLPIWQLSVDGAANAQGSGAGVILTSPDGIEVGYALRFGFKTSNNEAEYEAVIAGLNLAYSMEAEQLEVSSDSQLIVRQIEESYGAKGDRMILYLRKVRELMKKFAHVAVKYVPRVENAKADALARLATANQEDLGRAVPVEFLQNPSVSSEIAELLPISSQGSWMDPILEYIQLGNLPSDPKEAFKVKVRSSRFSIVRGDLYKRGFAAPLLKCVGGGDADYVLREVHEGICGNHIGARALAGKALKHGYYWPTMLQDAIDLVKKCRICQQHSNLIHNPAELLTPVTSPWPFQQWGLDILGPLPIGAGQCKFIIVGVDYFTKWVEAEPLAKITEQKIQGFVWKSILCRFGIPRSVVSDNGKQFDNPRFRDFCSRFGIKNYYSSPAHPQSNGQAEVTIRTIKAALKTKLEDLKGKWVEFVPEILWAYRTTVRSATQETPFALAYGSEAVAPVEIGLPSPRVEFTEIGGNDEALLLNLDLLDEKRDKALRQAQIYRARVARYYDRRVRPRGFKPGDLVLKKLLLSRKDPAHGKLGPNWEGPFIISRVVRPGNYELQTEEGRTLAHSWNAEHLRRFFQ